MTFAHYDLLLEAVRHSHDGPPEAAGDGRFVRTPRRRRRSDGRPRSLPRGRPDGPPYAA